MQAKFQASAQPASAHKDDTLAARTTLRNFRRMKVNVPHHRKIHFENEEHVIISWFWTGYPPQPRGGALANREKQLNFQRTMALRS